MTKLEGLKDFIAFDFETTGFAPPCKIIEIGAVKVKKGSIVDKYQSLINPGCKIPYHITRITKIKDDMVSSAPSLETVLPDFLNFIEDLHLVAHNANFDMRFLRYYAQSMGYRIHNPVVCSLSLSKKRFPQLPKHDLASVAHHSQIINEDAHRALQDAMVVAKILLKMLHA